MPRTFSGQRERANRRNRYSAEVQSNQPIIFNNETFKIGFTCELKNFVSFNLGEMDIICSRCQAAHFKDEQTTGQLSEFSLCCHKGKVQLPQFIPNEFFKNLCDNLCSHNVELKQRSKHYFANIRFLNAAFAMISSEAQIDESVANGVYLFKIHNSFYHRAGSLTTADGQHPQYAQLYFFDVETALQHRLRRMPNVSCDNVLAREISTELHRINPYIRSFVTMSEYCEQHKEVSSEMSMFIKVHENDDVRRYNDAIQTDVAAIFRSMDGEPPHERNMIIFTKNSNCIKKVSTLHPSLDPLAYPLLFPNGDKGWHCNIQHNIPTTSNAKRPRTTTTMLQYASYRLAIRPQVFSLLHRSQKLFLQWIVDMYVRIEGARLHYIRNNQNNLRADLYHNLVDFFQHGNEDVSNGGRQIILPSSFIGSPRNMFQNYLDAMSIVQHFGKPSLFITMTCNPSWPEIKNNLISADCSQFRPDIVVRVFKCKLKELINSILKKHIFGKTEALIYTIEFQKRGLPHAHILITLDEENKISYSEDIDKVVSAEIPDPTTHPQLYEYVKSHMMHGPCGLLNPNNVCMKNGECTKKFPKTFQSTTISDVNGYPAYKRRDNGSTVVVRGNSLDNRYVVPYSPYLLAKFNCHINVEICSSVRSVKYIYKYVYKGYDCASLEIGRVNDISNNDEHPNPTDEIEQFLNARYVGSTEATWRIYEYPMHYQTHTIIRLDCHLPGRQNVIFSRGNEQQAIENYSRTKLLAFFSLNQTDSNANNLLYTEIPLHYVWINSRKEWKARQRGSAKIISRMYCVSPKDIELFHLRLLLLHVKGPKNFEDLRTYEGMLYPTFVEACYARSIATNDNEWSNCLNEAKDTNSPKQIRDLFAFICALNVPTNACRLWEEFKYFMSEDFIRRYEDEGIAYNKSLIEIEEILITHNVSCDQLGLPKPRYHSHQPEPDDVYNNAQSAETFNAMYERANEQQRQIIDMVMREIQHHDTGSNVFCLTAHAGCGKTFVQTALIHKLNSMSKRCIATAFSGIAATLLIGGRTLHNVFKLPIQITENTICNISANSSHASFIRNSSLIIIDEISMCPINAIKAIDRLLKDISNNNNTIFGGKTLLLCGDFRQTLPVIPHANRVQLIENCIISWDQFQQFHKCTLTQNMRALTHEIEFVEFLKSLGNGSMPTFPQYTNDTIEIPPDLIGDIQNIIHDVFGNISETILSDDIVNSVILAPRNEDCYKINADILNRIPGQLKTFYSFDKIVSDDIREQNNYPIEFLNSIKVSGMPPHKLTLKENSIVLLIRNLNTSKALVNGTRMRIKRLYRNNIDCEVLTGVARGERLLLPRIHLTNSNSILPFHICRTQFPIIPAFAMTINKSQGQTFNNVGILLKEPVFSHGQMYVAASRARASNNLKFYVLNTPNQGRLNNDNRIFSKNIVYKEIII